MNEVSEKKKQSFQTILILLAVVAALVAAVSFLVPLFRKSSALGAVGGRVLSEMTPFSTAVSFYSGGDISQRAKDPNAAQEGYRSLSELLSQVGIQQSYEGVYLLYRDENKTPRYLQDGVEIPEPLFKPMAGLVDSIYTGKSASDYVRDLVLRADGKPVAVTCLPIYGGGRTVLAVLVVESDPGDTGYHLIGPLNLYYLGGLCVAICLLSVLLLWVIRRYRRGRSKPNTVDPVVEPAVEPAMGDHAAPEDDFQLPVEPVVPPRFDPETGLPLDGEAPKAEPRFDPDTGLPLEEAPPDAGEDAAP